MSSEAMRGLQDAAQSSLFANTLSVDTLSVDAVPSYLPPIQAIQGIATPVFLGISLIIAFFAMKNVRDVARKRATLDLIEKFESSENYLEIKASFLYRDRTKSFDKLHAPEESLDKTHRSHILAYLNHYDLVAIGIRNGILDYKFYSDWMGGPLVQDWNAAAEFIQRERWKWDKDRGGWVYYDRTFCDYGALARRLSPQKARKLDESWGKPEKPPRDPDSLSNEPIPSPTGA